jgi:hypothetical protein
MIDSWGRIFIRGSIFSEKGLSPDVTDIGVNNFLLLASMVNGNHVAANRAGHRYGRILKAGLLYLARGSDPREILFSCGTLFERGHFSNRWLEICPDGNENDIRCRAARDHVRNLQFKTHGKDRFSRGGKLGEIFMDIMYGCGRVSLQG